MVEGDESSWQSWPATGPYCQPCLPSISFEKANRGPTSVITSCQDTFVNWTCVHGPTYIVTE